MSRRILVTSALPNANGPIHLGHMLEHIQTDIWVRYQRMRGHEVHYVCADDTHGTATMIRADEEGVTPEALIEVMREEHLEDFRGFSVEHDNYYSTHSEENRYYSELIYERLEKKGLIFTEEVEQLYDPEKDLFLADRFVIGECPRCGEAGQYGDNCEKCAATYNATELKNPRSVYSGRVPELRSSAHYFFDLPKYTEFLREWTRSGTVQSEVANKLSEWLDDGLRAWDISRDAPYFGFLIPGTEDLADRKRSVAGRIGYLRRQAELLRLAVAIVPAGINVVVLTATVATAAVAVGPGDQEAATVKPADRRLGLRS